MTWSLVAEIEMAREDLQRTVAAARQGEEPWQEVRRARGVVESLVAQLAWAGLGPAVGWTAGGPTAAEVARAPLNRGEGGRLQGNPRPA